MLFPFDGRREGIAYSQVPEDVTPGTIGDDQMAAPLCQVRELGEHLRISRASCGILQKVDAGALVQVVDGCDRDEHVEALAVRVELLEGLGPQRDLVGVQPSAGQLEALLHAASRTRGFGLKADHERGPLTRSIEAGGARSRSDIEYRSAVKWHSAEHPV